MVIYEADYRYFHNDSEHNPGWTIQIDAVLIFVNSVFRTERPQALAHAVENIKSCHIEVGSIVCCLVELGLIMCQAIILLILIQVIFFIIILLLLMDGVWVILITLRVIGLWLLNWDLHWDRKGWRGWWWHEALLWHLPLN